MFCFSLCDCHNKSLRIKYNLGGYVSRETVSNPVYLQYISLICADVIATDKIITSNKLIHTDCYG